MSEATSSRFASIKFSSLKKRVRNCKVSNEKFISSSALVSLQELEAFIAEAKSMDTSVDGVRIYFIKYDKQETIDVLKSRGNRSFERYYARTNDNYTQGSIAFVPTSGFGLDTNGNLKANDHKNADGTILCYSLGDPEMVGEGTGLCPPNCNGSTDGGSI